jgi:hypothetical protein
MVRHISPFHVMGVTALETTPLQHEKFRLERGEIMLLKILAGISIFVFVA